MGQGGNVWQWEESAFDGVNDSVTETRGIRGGYWGGWFDTLQSSLRYDGFSSLAPEEMDSYIGFRVASVADVGSAPEPSTYALYALGIIGTLLAVRRKRLR
jgi:hypothetical protein